MAAKARRGADFDDDTVAPRSDAYTGLMIIAFVATLLGLLFLWLDYSDYSGKGTPPWTQLKAPTPTAPAPK